MVKEKPNSTRIYDKDGFRQRAACICVRSIEENEVSFHREEKIQDFNNQRNTQKCSNCFPIRYC